MSDKKDLGRLIEITLHKLNKLREAQITLDQLHEDAMQSTKEMIDGLSKSKGKEPF